MLLQRTWESLKQIIASHTTSARKHGMTPEMFHELMSVVGMANEANRLVNGYQVEIDEAFKMPAQ